MQELKNALAIIRQMKRGEWEFKGHYLYGFESNFTCCTAERRGVELWLASGAFFCSVREEPWQLGIIGGQLVWWLAARKRVRELENKMKRKPRDLSK